MGTDTDGRIPRRFRGDILRRLGHGGEATVYELSDGRALRVYHGAPHGAAEIAGFYRTIARAQTSFATPEIFEQGEEDGMFYSVDRLIAGRPLHELMTELAGDDRARALAAYIDAAFEIASLPLVREGFGEFLRDGDSIRAETWASYLLARMHRSLESAPWLRDDVPSLDAIVDAMSKRVAGMPACNQALVHGDYFPGNVLISNDLAVSGVIDFGPLTVIGDPALDVASAVIFLEVVRPGYLPADTDFARERVIARAGPAIIEAIRTYRAWYAVRFSPYRDDDPNLYRWCVRSMRIVAEELGI